MKQEQTHLPVIFLLDAGSNNGSVKKWFKKSRFLTSETINVFQVLEEIFDFTVRCRPDVVLLESESFTEDFLIIKKMFQTSSGQSEFPIFAFSESGNLINDNECFEGNFDQLKARLDQIVPRIARAKAAA